MSEEINPQLAHILGPGDAISIRRNCLQTLSQAVGQFIGRANARDMVALKVGIFSALAAVAIEVAVGKSRAPREALPALDSLQKIMMTEIDQARRKLQA